MSEEHKRKDRYERNNRRSKSRTKQVKETLDDCVCDNDSNNDVPYEKEERKSIDQQNPPYPFFKDNVHRSTKFLKTSQKNKFDTKNVGVSVESDMLPTKKLVDCPCFGEDPDGKPHKNVQDELRNVIEMMGSNIGVSDADNDSVYETSVYSSVVKISRKRNEDNCYCDDSQMTFTNIDEIEPEIEKTEIAVQTMDVKNDPIKKCSLPVQNVYPDYMPSNNVPYQQKLTSPNYFSHPRQCDTYIKPTKCTCMTKTVQPYGQDCKRYNWFPNIFSRGFIYGRKKHKYFNNTDLYKIGVIEQNDDLGPPKKLVFDLVENFPRPNQRNNATNTSMHNMLYPNMCNASMHGRNYNYSKRKENIPEMQYINNGPCNDGYMNDRTYDKTCMNDDRSRNITDEKPYYMDQKDIYYFDHGNSAYYRTTDTPYSIKTDMAIEKTEFYSSKFWAQIFSVFHLCMSFLTSLLLQLVRFILVAIIRPLTVGMVQLLSDYFFKPALAILFNGVIQPPLIFLYNVATSVRDIMKPIAESVGFFIRELAAIFKSFRLVEIYKNNCAENKKFDKNCKA